MYEYLQVLLTEQQPGVLRLPVLMTKEREQLDDVLKRMAADGWRLTAVAGGNTWERLYWERERK